MVTSVTVYAVTTLSDTETSGVGTAVLEIAKLEAAATLLGSKLEMSTMLLADPGANVLLTDP